MIKDDGGPAYPRPASEYTAQGTLPDGNDAIQEQDGMSLRDYFAAKALQGFIMVSAMPGEGHEVVAQHAYIFADAMLAQRAKG